jgi:phenylacetate-coenzyme A ligase PaaK-like adenylate-forming protein
MLAGYPSALGLLAEERIRGRLHIEPLIIWSGGEQLPASQRTVIENAFGAPVMNEYGASEGLSIAHECREGWMHLHEEWVVLEGVDAAGHPTPPGELSHDTLLTNLANWVQPVIRYQLGDRIVRGSAPCRCGNRLPAFRLEGRTEEPLAMRTTRGTPVKLLPLALTTVVEEVAGAHRFQIAKVGPSQLALRFEALGGNPTPRSVRAKAAAALKAHRAAQSLANVELVQDPKPPRIDRASGKLKCVVVELA